MMIQERTLLSTEEQETFDRVGAVLVRKLLDKEWLDLAAEAAEEVRTTVKSKKGESIEEGQATMRQKGDYVFCENAWTFNEKMRRLAFESPVAQAAAEAMQSREARLFETLFIYKEQGCDLPTGWHQDLPQHGMEGNQACSVWLSLDPVEEITGSLRFVPGSHKGPWYTPGTMPEGREHDRVPLPAGPCPDPDADRARFPEIVSYASEPGDVILLHPNVLHGTRGNPIGTRRRSFSIRFFGDDMRRKATRWEWHSWLKDLPLKDGDPMRAEIFPRIWPR